MDLSIHEIHKLKRKNSNDLFLRPVIFPIATYNYDLLK